MLYPISLSELGKVDLVPQAILNKPVSYFEKRGIHFVKGEDELDTYEGAAFLLDNNVRFALKHHPGYPDDTTTVCLAKSIHDLQQITKLVRKIVEALELSLAVIQWQRSDNPEL